MQIARRFPFPSETFSSKRVFAQISHLACGPKIQWHGRSFATSLPSDTPKVKKGWKRVAKAERQAMAESFVNKYRAINLGKFPTASNTQKEVGGSYYVIREILQELEYKSKISSINTRDRNSLSKELAKENKLPAEVEEVSSSQMIMDAGIHRDAQAVASNGADTGDSSCKHFEVKEGPQIKILVENKLSEEVGKPTGAGDDSKYVATQSHMLKEEAEEVLHPYSKKLEDDVKEKTPSKNVLKFDSPNPKSERHQQLPEPKKFMRRDLTETQTDEELQRKSSMWGNLKSLADGIINMWRKL